MTCMYRIAPVLLAAFAVMAACDSGGDDDGAGGNGGTTAAGGTGGASTGGIAGTSDNGGASGNGSTDTPATAACKKYCAAEEDCKAETTVEDCIGYTCVDFDTHTQACLDALAAYYNCLAVSSDPCQLPGDCAAEADAVGTAGCS